MDLDKVDYKAIENGIFFGPALVSTRIVLSVSKSPVEMIRSLKKKKECKYKEDPILNCLIIHLVQVHVNSFLLSVIKLISFQNVMNVFPFI